MSDRLNELHRQRTLIQEQLAWIDREIAREIAESSPPSAAQPHAGPAERAASRIPSAASQKAADPAAMTDVNAILAQYELDPKFLRSNVRKGCLMYFFLAFALAGAGLVALYFYSRSQVAERKPAASPPAQTTPR